jgi:hypothetical protein
VRNAMSHKTVLKGLISQASLKNAFRAEYE